MFAFDKKYLACILSIAFTGLMLPDILRTPVLYAVPSVAYLLLFNFCITYLICCIRPLATYGVPPIFFLSSLVGYFHGVYRIKIDKELVFLLLETNSGEAGEFITSEVLIYGVAALLFSLAMGFLLKRSTGRLQFKPLLVALLFVIPTTISLTKFKRNEHFAIARPITATKYLLPYNVVGGLAEFSAQYVKNMMRGELKSSAELESVATTQSEPLKVIVIVGESARADRFQINNYSRETTPLLSKEKNLINFGTIQSFSAYTRISVPAMITPATFKRPETTMDSYHSLFKKHGFDTVWMSANNRFTSKDTPTTEAIGNSPEKLFRNRITAANYSDFYDALFIEPLAKRLTLNKNQAISIHTRGSHANYAARYTKEFRKFTPDHYSGSMNIEAVNNAYDNSILATDAFITSVIDLVRNKNAVVIYSSDHGESLGEEGRFSHGNPSVKEQRAVPFFVWYSDKYNELNPQLVEALKNQVGNKLSHDMFFPWIVNLGGIKLINSDLPVLMTTN